MNTELNQSIHAAAQIIADSEALLMFGLDQLDMDSQVAALQLADVTRATIDHSLPNHHRGKVFAMQKNGKVTASWGEIRRRSDLLVCWFSDPATEHPEAFEILNDATVPSRKLVVVGQHPSKTSLLAEAAITVDRRHSNDLIAIIRAMNSNRPFDSNRFDDRLIETATQIVSCLESASNVAWLLPHAADGADAELDLESESLGLLIDELNRELPVFAVSLGDTNQTGAEYCLTAFGGFPCAIDLRRGFPRYQQNEHSAKQLLDRQQCDTVIVFTTPDYKLATDESTREVLDQLQVIEIGHGQLANANLLIPATLSDRAGTFRYLRADGAMLSRQIELKTTSSQEVIETLMSVVKPSGCNSEIERSPSP
ncbi:MAG: hypothetical protein AAFN77_00090 [Planctomycetota bacterium]